MESKDARFRHDFRPIFCVHCGVHRKAYLLPCVTERKMRYLNLDEFFALYPEVGPDVV